jgi:4-hydroxythreonine-4-phosphate dehydrogenase
MIGISMGDACGVGPEIILKAWLNQEIYQNEFVIGDLQVLSYCSSLLKLNVPLRHLDSSLRLNKEVLNVYDCKLLSPPDIKVGQISKKCAAASIQYVEVGTKMALSRETDALVTLPIHKEAVRLTYPDFSGHTSFIADLCEASDYTMMLASDKLIVTHISTHLSLKKAIETITIDRILLVTKLTHEVLGKLKKSARIAVAGLNPHAGEGGAFGEEDFQIILPAVEAAKKQGYNVEGPIPPDTVFYQAVKGRYDAVVCMYHDQGHIPMKVLDFERGVNVTLGLPIIRTSVDHGTAFDIAYKGIADIQSFVAALKMARCLKPKHIPQT